MVKGTAEETSGQRSSLAETEGFGQRSPLAETERSGQGNETGKRNAPAGRVRISVVMPTYNGGRFLRAQLDSILEQLSGEDEVIVSDDGSSDDTRAILAEYKGELENDFAGPSGNGKNSPALRLLKGPKKGVKQNVGFGLSHCRGDFIFLADQDDIWAEDKVARVMEIFERKKAGLVIHDAVVFAEDIGKPLMDSFFRFRGARAGIVKNFTKNSYIGCCMAFRRELLEQALPIPEEIEMHDQWIGILNDFYYKNSYFYEKPLIYYRRHGENNSGLTHYGPMKMIRNRLVFLWRFLGRILIENRKWKK